MGIIVRHEGGMRCVAESRAGALVTTDAPQGQGGMDRVLSPSDLLAVSLGSCILSMMAVAAVGLGVDLAGAEAFVEKRMADGPRRLEALSVTIRIGRSPPADARAALQPATGACPVHAALAIACPIHFEWLG